MEENEEELKFFLYKRLVNSSLLYLYFCRKEPHDIREILFIIVVIGNKLLHI
jgi:hypothetical protein